MTRLILQFDFEDRKELDDLISDLGGDLDQWVFGELCQNHGFGFLSSIRIEEKKEK